MIDWTECSPRQAGIDARGLARALDLVHERRAPAQLCVLRDGQVVLDPSIGCRPERCRPITTSAMAGPGQILPGLAAAHAGRLLGDDV
jgi:hypothetical protein